MKRLIQYSLAALAAAPGLVSAHTGAGADVGGAAAGLFHPLTGFDHLLAAAAVGLWAFQQRGREGLAIGGAYLVALAAGAVFGVNGVALPGVEPGILASLLVLGLLVATAVRIPAAAAGTLVALFALFHGNAHGVEMPATSPLLLYLAGLLVATAAIQGGAQWGARLFAGRPRLLRLAGVATAAAGAAMALAR